MRLVPNWKRAWRWLSVQAMLLAVSLQGAWMAMPDEMRASVSPNVVQAFTIVLLVLGVIGRMVDQSPKDKP